jgi:hypothetical protein
VIPTPARLALTIDEAGRFGSVSFLADDADARARLMALYLKLRPEIDQFEQRLQARIEAPETPKRLRAPATALRAVGRRLSTGPPYQSGVERGASAGVSQRRHWRERTHQDNDPEGEGE